MSAQGCFPAGPRTGQQRSMTTVSRRQDLAIVALPRRTFPAFPLGALKRVWNGGVREFSLVVVRGSLEACGFATEVEQDGRGAFLARSTRNGAIASRNSESECLAVDQMRASLLADMVEAWPARIVDVKVDTHTPSSARYACRKMHRMHARPLYAPADAHGHVQVHMYAAATTTRRVQFRTGAAVKCRFCYANNFCSTRYSG
jgi:hypothetical protein